MRFVVKPLLEFAIVEGEMQGLLFQVLQQVSGRDSSPALMKLSTNDGNGQGRRDISPLLMPLHNRQEVGPVLP